MIANQRPVFALVLLTFVLCFSLVEANPGRPRPTTKTTSTSCSSSTTSTTCTPTAVQTAPATLTFAQFPTGSPGDGYDIVFGPDWGYVACSVYTSNSCTGNCQPKCCNKGVCGTSTSTNLLLGYPNSSPPGSPNFSIVPRSPATGFTIFDLTFTASEFLPKWPSISVQITGESMYPGNPPVVQTVVIPKPSYGQFYSSVTKNLPIDLSLGSVKKLDWLSFYTGSENSGGQAPGGRVYAQVRLDGNGTGGGIHFEAYTPLGCGYTPHKRDGGMSISPVVLVKRSLEGDKFA